MTWAAECYFCGRETNTPDAESLLKWALDRHRCRQGSAATGRMRPTLTKIREVRENHA